MMREDAQLWPRQWRDDRANCRRLKDRVAVLERLLTDDDRKLAGEIERLRREDVRG